MTNAIILIDDQSDDIIWTSPTGAWPVGLSNMQDPRLSKVARSVDCDPDNTRFFMSFPEPITVQDVVFAGTNIDVDAMGRITAYSDALFSEQIYTSGLVPLYLATTAIQDTDSRGLPIIMHLGQEVTSAYYYMEIQNPYNTDGFIQLAKSFFGRRMNLDYNFETASFGRDPRTLIDEALAGARYYNRHKSIRSWTLSFTGQTYDTGWDEFDKAFELCGLDRPVFIIPFPDDDERKQRQSFLGNFSTIPELQMLQANLVSTSVAIVESVG